MAGTRRPRYRGTHPRQFHEKYKELAADPAIVAHVRERGQTPAGQHVPIMVDEILAALDPRPGQRGVDATVGWGGHAQRMLARIAPHGHLLALDADPIELPRTEARLRALGFGEDVLVVKRTNFAGVRAAIGAAGWHDGVHFLLADLGASSMQFDDPARGFSFKGEGPLDMRMNPQRGLAASRWIALASEDALIDAFEGADEPQAAAIAAALVEHQRQHGALATTRALADAVRDALRSRVDRVDVELAVRRVFQAIRIAVNDEFGALDALLRQLPDCLRAGGRAAFLSFHSGEDRRVKKAFQDGQRTGVYSTVSPDVTRPSPAEQRSNPRATAAKLRWVERARP
jgi:16S rRNA (cytosine1402-N4)-methyltransferase